MRGSWGFFKGLLLRMSLPRNNSDQYMTLRHRADSEGLMKLCPNWQRSSHAYGIAQPDDEEEGSTTEDEVIEEKFHAVLQIWHEHDQLPYQASSS